MISEKTVELNLTVELVNWNFYISGIRPYILAPSQREEGILGFDTSIGYPYGYPTLIQYKRAYFKKKTNELEYYLNRNTSQDQHLRLFVLELLGYDVLYVLPLFYSPSDVINYRRRLLTKTLFLRPSWLSPKIVDMTGHHSIKYNLTTKSLTFHSEKGKNIDKTYDFYDFARELERSIFSKEKQVNLNYFFENFNKVMANKEEILFKNIKLKPIHKNEKGLLESVNIVINQAFNHDNDIK